MNIFIIAAPRTGSTKFLEAISKAYNLKPNHEPFNYDVNPDSERLYRFKYAPDKIKNNEVYKCLTWFNHWPTQFKSELVVEEEKNIQKNEYLSKNFLQEQTNFFLKYAKNFDRIILLLRKNIGDQIKSKIIADYTWNNTLTPKISVFHKKYKDIDVKYDQVCVTNTNLLLHSIEVVTNISNRLNIPILYYEDLYTTKEKFIETCNNFNLLLLESVYDEFINPTLRYRKFT